MFDTYRGLALDRFQQDAIEGIAEGEDVLVAAPTGAGKTLIAHYALEQALEQGKRAIYTAPIKALSNQKYRDLSLAYPGKVGISTGDVSIDADAPIVIMTTEIFRNTIFEDSERLGDVGWLILDEVHFLDDPERGTVWEETLIFSPPHVRVLALSATVSNLYEFSKWLEEVRDSTVRVVLEEKRPVPLKVYGCSTEGGVRPLEKIDQLRLRRGQRTRWSQKKGGARAYFQGAWKRVVQEVADREELPLLFFLFSRAACEELASACAEIDFGRSDETARQGRAEFRRLIAAFDVEPTHPEVRALEHLIQRGIAYHHAGVLPALKEVIERLFGAGYVSLLCATETFALGVNMPARAVAFEGIRKWNGQARVQLMTRAFQQMAGRAGRRGMDAEGSVYVTFNPQVEDPRMVTQVATGSVEPVRSQFNLSYGTLLNLYDRLGDKIFTACERSFAHFRAERQELGRAGRTGPHDRGRHRGKHKGKRDRRRGKDRGHPLRDEGRGRGRKAKGGRFKGILDQVRRKLDVLFELQYLDADGKCTGRGNFARAVFGHELQMAELVWSGAYDDLDAEQIAVLTAAVVFEPRKGVHYGGEDPRRILGKKVHRVATQAITNLAGLEETHGVKDPVPYLDWGISGLVWAWVNGEEFAKLRELTDASDGDVVRILRQTIQLLRLSVDPLRQERKRDLANRFRSAHSMLKRGLVDAEVQLRKGNELEAERLSGMGAVSSLGEVSGLGEVPGDDSGASIPNFGS